MENITVIGLVVIIVMAAVKEVFGWFRQKNLQNSETRLKAVEESVLKLKGSLMELKSDFLEPIKSKLEVLHAWHDKSDQDGVKIWYVRKSLEDTMRDTAKAMTIIAKNSELQTRLLEEIEAEQRVFRNEQHTLTSMVGTIRDKNTGNG